MDRFTVRFPKTDAAENEAASLSVFQPEEVTCMRHALQLACINASVPIDSETCFEIARKVISSYRPGLTEQELVAALGLMK